MTFTRPYGRFDEGVMVRAGEDVREPADLAGRRVAAISGSTNLRTAQAFAGAELVEFAGDTDDVFGDMIAALRAGEVDAFVDDEPPLQELDAEAADLALGFVVPCANPYAIAVRHGSRSRCARRSTTRSARHRRAASWRRSGSAGSRASPCPIYSRRGGCTGSRWSGRRATATRQGGSLRRLEPRPGPGTCSRSTASTTC